MFHLYKRPFEVCRSLQFAGQYGQFRSESPPKPTARSRDAWFYFTPRWSSKSTYSAYTHYCLYPCLVIYCVCYYSPIIVFHLYNNIGPHLLFVSFYAYSAIMFCFRVCHYLFPIIFITSIAAYCTFPYFTPCVIDYFPTVLYGFCIS